VFARCVYTDCGGQVLNETAAIHVYNCQINGSPSALSQSQLIADGEPAGSGMLSLVLFLIPRVKFGFKTALSSGTV
jgi:hypothetical protein